MCERIKKANSYLTSQDYVEPLRNGPKLASEFSDHGTEDKLKQS